MFQYQYSLIVQWNYMSYVSIAYIFNSNICSTSYWLNNIHFYWPKQVHFEKNWCSRALTVTWVSKSLHWLLVRSVNIYILISLKNGGERVHCELTWCAVYLYISSQLYMILIQTTFFPCFSPPIPTPSILF